MKSKTHTRYKLKDGTIVPGVTTITAELGWNKRVLINWANNLGLKGIVSSKFTDEKAEIGTLAHAMVTDTLVGKTTDTSDYSKNIIDQAQNCALSFWEWKKGKKLEGIKVELPLVSEVYKFGGTPDIYCKIDGVWELIDLKTGKGIYDEYSIQVAGAYKMLLEENGYAVEKVRILNIPRTEDESFQQKVITEIGVCREIFLHALKIYQLKKELKK